MGKDRKYGGSKAKQCCIHAKPQSHLERQATTIFTWSWRTRFLIGCLKMKLSYLTKNT